MSLNPLRLGQVKPHGWTLNLMRRDFESGFVGHLDKLVPDLFADDLYGADRLTDAVEAKEVGAFTGNDQENSAQFLWWNSETQSNWRDGWLRHALLVGEGKGRLQARAWVNRILATQDADGYLGIYAPDLRYRFRGENGELWAQATLFRGLLGYFDATGEARVLEAVVRAVRRTRDAWPLPGSHPFDQPGGYSGNAHGLMFVDVLDELFRLTGDREYRTYAVGLYREYCGSAVSEPDAQKERLLDPSYRFEGHGVHTWEHLRAVVLSAAEGDSTDRLALEAYLVRLQDYVVPSGAPIGDEWIRGRRADADETGYEYCSIVELFDSYAALLRQTGHRHWADRMEHLLFNAALGARHPSEPSLAYLKTDNCFSLTGVKHLDWPEAGDDTQTRYRSSPVHQEAAVCCVPNAGRILPSYVRHQVLADPKGLRIALYGPALVRTEVGGRAVALEMETDYPDALTVELRLYPEEPYEFSLFLRIPEWAEGTLVTGDGASAGEMTDKDGWLELRRTWNRGDSLSVVFEAMIETHRDHRGHTWFTRGPLVWALPLAERTEVTRTWPFGGFRELKHWPAEPSDWSLAPGGAEKAVWSDGAVELPLAGPDGTVSLRRLAPLKQTLLRRVTFPEAGP